MNNSPQNEFKHYIRQQWMRDRLQTYAFMYRLKNDRTFRNEWVRRRIQKEDLLSQKNAGQLLQDFIESLELVPTINSCGKPVIRIHPRRFHKRSCQELLDIDLKHTTTCLNLLLDESAEKIIAGYGIVQVLGSVFGDEYKKMVTRHVIKKMQKKLKPENAGRP